jgi:hypothetical protein
LSRRSESASSKRKRLLLIFWKTIMASQAIPALKFVGTVSLGLLTVRHTFCWRQYLHVKRSE